MLNVATAETEVIPQLKERLSSDLRKLGSTMTDREARYYVDAYYQIQGFRIRAGNQAKAASRDDEPNALVTWLSDQMEAMENDIRNLLNRYAKSKPAGLWMMSITGIGPVIAAGFLAHVNPEKMNSVSSLWAYAGVANVKWNKKCKRPWNADLKRLQWIVGQSFVKVQNNDKDVYGKLYREYKDREIERNERGEFADQAKDKLATCNIGKDTEAYKHYTEGKLPPGHIDARARRKAAKIFLSHVAQVMYECHHNKPIPEPYAFAILNHKDKMEPPGWAAMKRELIGDSSVMPDRVIKKPKPRAKKASDINPSPKRSGRRTIGARKAMIKGIAKQSRLKGPR